METKVLVYVDLHGSPELVGRLWARMRKDKESALFEYDPSWLARPDRFSLDPVLRVGAGSFHARSDKPLFGAIGDSAPDRWGRVLMRRAERRRTELAGETPRTLREIDYLLMVDDEARLGALRFTEAAGGPFLAVHRARAIPPLIQLPALLSAAVRITDDTESDEDLRLLLAPGSSLGGARPKASVRDHDKRLLIAKFPNKNDELDAVRWEAVALELAGKAGIDTPVWRLEEVEGKAVLLVRRFDRMGKNRIPYVSAMSMLDAKDNETRSYLEFVDTLRQHGAAPKLDMHQLWRRIVFNILISNTDDHLRNHGFLYVGTDGWRLAPAYDLNPVPVEIKPRVLSTTIDLDNATASIELALSVTPYFEIRPEAAKKIVDEVAHAVVTWRDVAARYKLTRHEIERMRSAFEHDDLKRALGTASVPGKKRTRA